MQYRFFTIPGADPGEAAEELNRFLRSVRVLQVSRHFDVAAQAWRLAVEYLDGPPGSGGGRGRGRNRADYREVLEPEEFARFDRLRAWRKEQAEKEGVPTYAIFTNEQLAAIVRLEHPDRAALGGIDGIGESRLNKYGDSLLELLAAGPGELEK
jgi:superfamily II DNA helicase RecQ